MKVGLVCVVLALSSHCTAVAGADGQLQVIPGKDGQWKAYRDSDEVDEIAFLSMCGQTERAEIVRIGREQDEGHRRIGYALFLAAAVGAYYANWKHEETECENYKTLNWQGGAWQTGSRTECFQVRKVQWPLLAGAVVVGGWGINLIRSASKRAASKHLSCEEAEVLAATYNGQMESR